MKKEENLSEKREGVMKSLGYSYSEKDVKEFIRKLKEELERRQTEFAQEKPGTSYWYNHDKLIDIIDKLAGEKLI